MIENIVLPHDLRESQWERRIRHATIGCIYNCFPARDTDRRDERQDTKHDQREDGRTESKEDGALRVYGFLRNVGYTFDRQKEPDRKGNSSKRTRPSVRKGILRQVAPLNLRQG